MPIKIQSGLHVKELLEQENIFVMDDEKAEHQDIRPLQILILNLMPTKEQTELQLLRCLSNSPLQVDVSFLAPSTHHYRDPANLSHTKKNYLSFREVCGRRFDGFIITGAPVEKVAFEEVDYWVELTKIFRWAETNVTSTIFICWAAQAALYYYYGVRKRELQQKLSGVYAHRTIHRKVPLIRGFDDVFLAPHSRHTEVSTEDVRAAGITVLAESDEAGFFLGTADRGRKIFIQGHLEYDRLTLDQEYKRDLANGSADHVPVHYYTDNDPSQAPLLRWRAVSLNFYANWLNYYVYQVTPYNLSGAPVFTWDNIAGVSEKNA